MLLAEMTTVTQVRIIVSLFKEMLLNHQLTTDRQLGLGVPGTP